MPTPNTELARRVLEHIEAHPEQWNQSRWALRSDCGTSYCFAGHAVHLTHPDALYMFGLDLHDGDDRDAAVKVLIPGVAGPQYVRTIARELLGLSDYNATLLFYSDNTLDDLRSYVEQLEAPLFSGELLALRENPWDDDYADDDASSYEEYA